jgi:maltooligosyltrehalose trehalohydrolase
MPDRPRFGAFPLDDGHVLYRVWAPNATSVSVELVSDTGVGESPDPALQLEREVRCLAPQFGGVFEGRVPGGHGQDYLFVLDGDAAWPDPCSRWQPHGLRGPSRVLDTSRFEVAPGPEIDREHLVVYELHVGTFSDEGTFDGAIPHLPALAELGVTAIEPMPVATFPGERGWGYDGVYISAPHRAYGGPDGLARLVDAAHRAGLAVILDVVYNHLGPGSEAITAFAPYVTDRHGTPWGGAIDFSQPAVRQWAIENAELWVRDYRIDGLRVDAVFAIFDDSPQHVLAELRERLPDVLLIAEEEVGNSAPIDDWGFDAQWADDFHHELHVGLTGESHGYYGEYGSLANLARLYERAGPERFVYCSQNHDQVGNRATGDRPHGDELELRAAALLFAPQIPLLFMGEEYGEQRPFQYFTDHDDPEIAEATREGRRREFDFARVRVPDPQALETFLASKLSREERSGLRDLYRDLLLLRRELPRDTSAAGDDSARIVRVRRGNVQLVADFESRTVTIERDD